MGHDQRYRRIAFDDAGGPEEANDSPSALLAAPATQFAFVPAVAGATVMLHCLGNAPPATYSRLYCPLIFLSVVDIDHEDYRPAMEFWAARFSLWPEWVDCVRRFINGLGPDPSLDQVSRLLLACSSE